MQSLKVLCFNRILSLGLAYDDIPVNLQLELNKMKRYNGTFSNIWPHDGGKSFITIQYMGDKLWMYRFGQDWSWCSYDNCFKKVYQVDGTYAMEHHCSKNNQLEEILLKENEETKISLHAFKALQELVWKGLFLKEDTSIRLTQDGSGTLELTSEHTKHRFKLYRFKRSARRRRWLKVIAEYSEGPVLPILGARYEECEGKVLNSIRLYCRY